MERDFELTLIEFDNMISLSDEAKILLSNDAIRSIRFCLKQAKEIDEKEADSEFSGMTNDELNRMSWDAWKNGFSRGKRQRLSNFMKRNKIPEWGRCKNDERAG